jgi:hypothetical protein
VPTYPIVVRNHVPDVVRGFKFLWVAILCVVTRAAWGSGAPDGTKWWPLILPFFWITGVFALRWAFSAKAGQLTRSAATRAGVPRSPL